MPRTETYNEEISRRLKKPVYAREFISGLMEGPDGMSVEDALRHTIQIMGLKEFAQISGIPSPNLVSFLKGRRNVKVETIDQMLKPFKLKTRIIIEEAS